MVPGRRRTTDSTSGAKTERSTPFWNGCKCVSTKKAASTGDLWLVDGTSVRAHAAAAGAEKRGLQEPKDHALGRSRGGFGTKIHLVADSDGTLLAVHVTPGQTHEVAGFESVVDAVRIPQALGRPRTRPLRMAGDKGYDVPWLRDWLRRRRITPIIPEKHKPHGRKPGRRSSSTPKPIAGATSSRARSAGSSTLGELPLDSRNWRSTSWRCSSWP